MNEKAYYEELIKAEMDISEHFRQRYNHAFMCSASFWISVGIIIGYGISFL